MADAYDDRISNSLRSMRQAMVRGDRSAVLDAVDALRAVVDRAGTGHPNRGIFLTNLSSSLILRYRLTVDVSDLDEALHAGREALTTRAVPEPQRTRLAAQLNQAQAQRIELYGLPDDLAGAVSAFAAAVDGVRDPTSQVPRYRVAEALITQYEQTSLDGRGLDDAIHLLDGLVTATDTGELLHAAALTGLTNAHRLRFESRGDTADLRRSVETARKATRTIGLTAENEAAVLSNLSSALRLNALYGSDDDIAEAVKVGRRAVLLSPDSPTTAKAMGNLGTTLRTRFELKADPGSLDEAIKYLREADRVAPPGHPDRPRWLTHLAIALLQRFGRLGEPADLDRAIGYGTDALAYVPRGHHDRPAMLDHLGCAYLARFQQAGVLPDLNESVRRVTEAVGTSPRRHPQHFAYVGNLSIVARLRFTVTHDRSDLAAAIRYGREARSTIQAGHASRPAVLLNLCDALRAQFENTFEGAEIDEAVQVGEEAVEITPPHHPYRAMALDSLASARQRRFRHSAARADADEAALAWDEAAGQQTGTARIRIVAAYETAELFASSAWRSWAEVVARFSTAVHLLPLLAWRGVSRTAQDQALAAWPSLGRDAAACAVIAADPARSVELLEQGRTVLWTQLLELRTDLDALRRGEPQAASRLDAIRGELDRPALHITQSH